MKIRCDRGEIVEKLSSISGIIPTNSAKAILYDFLLRTKGEALLAEATDLEVCGIIEIERVEVLEQGSLTIPAAKLLSILREIPSSVAGVIFEHTAGESSAMLRADGFEFRLLGHEPSEFPISSELQAKLEIKISRDQFVQSLRTVAVASARDTSRHQLAGVCLEASIDRITLTATDGKRLANDSIRIDGPGPDRIEAIIPNRAVDAILKILATGNLTGSDETFQLGFTETEVIVRAGRNQLSARLIEGSYPKYQSAFPRETPIKVRVRRPELLAAARSAQLMADDQTFTVIFRFEEGQILIWSQSKNVGETKIQIKASVENGPLQIRFNPSYVIDALRCIDDEEVRMDFASGDRPGILRGGQNYRHLIMPLVVEGTS